ncbi:Major facilitator superfamily domain, general substrate transporter [Pseudocohnilembus persalinus]|uniref:Major facilitator superfamily domain, general substrate transporter n=1 Tax=Pseudocohnilembus persalinus TaxID=266149 RepID=A0A0V0QW39_PSEPJ|nr:Major facilitator superfamily domain, general substrate transporter [Pseudocohnilembus persalinus]|eukprot:KRX06406.1 Major facilitator superfamily domain, general substrate transporter [Pseudocohnilembus persalinus]
MFANISRNLVQSSGKQLFKNQQFFTPTVNFHFCSQQNPIKNESGQQIVKKSWRDRFFGPEKYTGNENTNRWLMALPAIGIHLCIGGPYAWSIFAQALTQEFGVVASSALDWTLNQTTFPLSLCFMMQGVSAALAGGLQIKYGLRLSLLAASSCYFTGVVIGAAGIYFHSLSMLYMGYGFLAGIGVGTAYTPPLQALMQWLPDRKGLASGLIIAGFGSGAVIMGPSAQYLMKKFHKFPEYVGKITDVETYQEAGKLFAKVGGQAKEVVEATAADLAKIPGSEHLQEGLYIVGTGNTGAAAALGILGVAYTGIMLASSMAIKQPPVGYVPKGFDPSLVQSVTKLNVNHMDVFKTKQFWSFMAVLCCIATGGIGMMSVAKSMMQDQFSVLLPGIVTSTFATSYVLLLSFFNMGGRLFWSSLYDKYGPKFVYRAYSIISTPAYVSLPFIIGAVVQNPSAVPLYAFMGSTCIIISILGGVYATQPAYESQIFGNKYVGAIHGKMLLGSSFGAFVGPQLYIQMRNFEERKALKDLLSKVDPAKFQQHFKVGIDQAQSLIEAKTLTISKLMQIVPPGIKDPTPYLYNSALLTCAGLMGVAAIAHSQLKPVDPKFYEENQIQKAAEIMVEQQEKQQDQNQEEEQQTEQEQKDKKQK